MNELLIYFAESKFKNQVATFEDLLPIIETAISDFNDLEVLGTFNREEYNALFSNPKEYFFEKLMEGKPLMLAGMKLTKEKVFDLLEKPENYFNLIAEIEDLQKSVSRVSKTYLSSFNLENPINVFEFNEAGELQLKQKVKDEIKRKNEVYVSKESSKSLFRLFTELEKMFNESKEVIDNTCPPFYRIGDFLHRYLDFVVEEKKYKIIIEQIKFHDNNAKI